MIKVVLASVSIIAIMGQSTFVGADEEVNDLENHETIFYSPSMTQLTYGGENASSLEEVLEARISAGAYDAQFNRDLPDGSAVIARMTYANYDFQPVWTPKSVTALNVLCRDHDVWLEDCKTSKLSDIADIRFTSGSEAEQADADVALTRIFLNYAAKYYSDTYSSGQWVEREPGQAEPILVASIREVGEKGLYDAIEILDPTGFNVSNSSTKSSATATYSLP